MGIKKKESVLSDIIFKEQMSFERHHHSTMVPLSILTIRAEYTPRAITGLCLYRTII